MKEFAALILFLVGSMFAYAQSTVENFKNKYQDDDDATSITIRGNLFDLMGDIAELSDDEEAEAAARVFKGIKSMNLLRLSLYDAGITKQEVADFKIGLEKEKYEEYVNVREGKETINVYANGSKDKISNMVIVIQERDDFTLVTLDGTLSHKDIAYIIDHCEDWDGKNVDIDLD